MTFAPKTLSPHVQAAQDEALLAAHHAMPGESCALVDWREEIAA